ncbi:MAG: hypothetical protein Q8R02_12005 [Hyphomonadaceae bacterium]|nr:hypothetical protein [Hyphomonadaceae bacterium]
MRAKWAVIALVATSAGLTGAAYAGKLTKAAEAEIRKMIDIVAPSGDRIGAIQYGELSTGGMASISFEGDQLHEYYFNATCDDDCGDLNLAVLDAAGVELDVDDADDAAPVVEVLADRTAPGADEDKANPRPMTIEVRMIACKAATCAYGFAVTRTE